MAFPDTRMTVASNLWIRQMHFAKTGDVNEGHTHNFDHLTLVAKGSVKVTIEGVETVFTAPHVFITAQGKRHFIEALENDTVAYCVHALRNAEAKDAEILLPDQIPQGVNLFSAGKVRPL